MLLLFSLGQSKAQLSIVEIMYNNPGQDIYEYVKVWNTSGQDVDLANYQMNSGFEVDFPSAIVGANDWFFVVVDSAAFVQLPSYFGQIVIQGDGALNNNGEQVSIIEIASGQVIDEVTYDDGGDWPTFADGNGASIHFCGTNADDKNDGNLWTVPTGTLGIEVNGQPLYGILGDIIFQCTERGRTSFFSNASSVLESDGVVNIPVYVDRGMQGQVNLTITASNGTTDVSDFNLLTSTFLIDTDTTDVINVQLEILDDSDLEIDEQLTLSFEAFTDEYLSLTNEISVNIIDNDTPLTEDLIITGVFDAQPGFAGTKGAEFFALNDIPDLSVYGVGVVNNGNGSDGVEYTFPAQSLAAGEFIYLVEDSTEFADYFGQSTSFVFPSINVNGDDAIELFENAQPLDVFGDIDMDGTGTTWEYLDGWAYRNAGTGPDGTTFLVGNWTYGGIDALEGPATNALAPTPFPIGTYSIMVPTELMAQDDSFTFPFGTTEVVLDVISNDFAPEDIVEVNIVGSTIFPNVSVTDTFSIVVTIEEGYCGTSEFTYSVETFNDFDEAQVSLTVECEVEFPLLDIGTVTTEDAMGVADSIGTTCELIGTVYGVNLSDSGVLFAIIDENSNGITVFSGDPDLGYTVTEGDEVSVRGEITQFNGLTEIIADEIEFLSAGNPLLEARVVTSLGEDTESNLVTINDVMFTDVTQWGGGASGFNFTVTDGANEYEIRIDNNVDLFLMPAPFDGMGLNITGIGGQFDNSSPFDGSYQLLPRYESDIEMNPLSTLNVLASQVDMFPNPTNQTLNINSEESLDMIRVIDALGRVVFEQKEPQQQLSINVSDYTNGVYSVEAIKDNAHLTMMLIVQ